MKKYAVLFVLPMLLVGAAFVGASSNVANRGALVFGASGGVIRACVEPNVKGNRATSGDIKINNCRKGYKVLTWNIAGPKGDSGAAGATGATGTNGTNGTNASITVGAACNNGTGPGTISFETADGVDNVVVCTTT